MRSIWVVPLVVTLTGCGRESGRTMPTGSSSQLVLEAPPLLTPQPDAAIPQNDDGIGCPAHEARGYGFEIRFDWGESRSSEGVVGYDLYVQHRTSVWPMIDQRVTESRHLYRSCNGFVIDENLDNWEWRVRAVDARGHMSEWSEARPFRFEPCRTAPGRRCWAPPA